MNLIWAHSEWLIALYLLPIFIGIWVIHDLWASRARARLGQGELQKTWLYRRSAWRKFARNALALLAFFFGIVAIANPQKEGEEIEVEKKGLDIVFALDMSRSMLAQDVAPSRLLQAKQFIGQVIDLSAGDRIGIMAFSSGAYKQLPLTSDHSAAKMMLNNMSPNNLPSSGSNFASALDLAPQVFDENVLQDKALIIISDGENHSPGWEEAVRNAVDSGIYVFTAAVGTTHGSPIPTKSGEGFHTDQEGEVVITKRDDSVLRSIAETGNGEFYDANFTQEAEALIEELRKLKVAEFGVSQTRDMEDLFQLPLGIAILSLTIRALFTERSSNTLEKWLQKV